MNKGTYRRWARAAIRAKAKQNTQDFAVVSLGEAGRECLTSNSNENDSSKVNDRLFPRRFQSPEQREPPPLPHRFLVGGKTIGLVNSESLFSEMCSHPSEPQQPVLCSTRRVLLLQSIPKSDFATNIYKTWHAWGNASESLVCCRSDIRYAQDTKAPVSRVMICFCGNLLSVLRTVGYRWGLNRGLEVLQ